MKYRPEIDGLRALAVMPVVLYHAGISWISGGYLGVDVFFVISGFLITGILIEEMRGDRFSLSGFYERRARRILPAVLFVILATLAFAPLVMWKWQLEELSRSALSTLGFLANHYFLEAVDYFRTDAENYPLLHMWSLAVEEQYYFIMPLALLALHKARAGLLAAAAAVGMATIVSLVAAVSMANQDADTVFYLLPFRAYELGIGSLAAFLVAYRGRINEDRSMRIAPACLAIVVLSYLVVPADVVMPWAKLPLLLATAAMLGCTLSRGAAYRLLSSRPLRWIGLISFSLYLWHQPVLAFARLHFGHIDTLLAGLLIVLSFFLAWLTYRFIETPFRSASAGRRRVFAIAGSGIAATAAASFLAMSITPPADSKSAQNAALARSVVANSQNIWGQYREVQDRPFTTDKEHVLLIGDSFSQDFWLMAKAADAFGDAEVSAHYIHYRCQPYIGQRDITRLLDPRDREFCADRAALAPSEEILREADTIILAAAWRPWSARMIAEIVDDYRVFGAKIIVIGRKRLQGNTKHHFRGFLSIPESERSKISAVIDDQNFLQAERMRDALTDAAFVNFYEQACDIAARTCPIFDKDGFIVTFDGKHLTSEGAKFFAPLLFDSDPLRRFLPVSAPVKQDTTSR